jgi:two-component system response regulator FixJ
VTESLVHVIDDDEAMRDSLSFLLDTAGFEARAYEGPAAFLKIAGDLTGGCVVTDVRMPEMSGLDLLRRLKEQGVPLPVIVITGHGDVPLAVEAMKAGAVDFLEKPLHAEPLRNAVRAAMEQGTRLSSPDAERYRQIVESLTRRQRQVLEGLIEGLPNKLIAYRLDLSIRTVEGYRAAIMERTQAKSLSELVRLAINAGM